MCVCVCACVCVFDEQFSVRFVVPSLSFHVGLRLARPLCLLTTLAPAQQPPPVRSRPSQALQKELQAAGRSLDYVFVSHTEPDHSGLIPAVLDLYPEATVCGSKVQLGGRRKEEGREGGGGLLLCYVLFARRYRPCSSKTAC